MAIKKYGRDEFVKAKQLREEILKKMLQEFNEERSKTYYCIASTVLDIEELEAALKQAIESSKN